MSCVPNNVLLDSLLARRTAIAFPKEACEMMFWCRKLASTGSFACKQDRAFTNVQAMQH